MDKYEILALIFAILLLLCAIPNIIVDVNIGIWGMLIVLVNLIYNIAAPIWIMIGACRRLKAKSYFDCKILLIGSAIISLLIFLFLLIFSIFNWPKLLNIAIIIPLSVFVHLIYKDVKIKEEQTTHFVQPTGGTLMVTQIVYQPPSPNYQSNGTPNA